MSVGFFMGITSSYITEALDIAKNYIAEINRTLISQGMSQYVEPETPDVYNDGFFGRSALDHHSAASIAKIGEMYQNEGENVTHVGLLRINPYRVSYIPKNFKYPLSTLHEEEIFGKRVKINVGSAPMLMCELQLIAKNLKIPLDEGQLTDNTARKINNFESLFDGDTCDFAEDVRTAWLVLYEGARLAMKNQIALALAG